MSWPRWHEPVRGSGGRVGNPFFFTVTASGFTVNEPVQQCDGVAPSSPGCQRITAILRRERGGRRVRASDVRRGRSLV